MNREILFRGKELGTYEWKEGYLVKRPSSIQIGEDYSPWYIFVPPRDPDDCGGYYNVSKESIGQYIGLNDKNGKRIFEGDILGSVNSVGRMINEGEVKYGEFNCSCCSGVYGWYLECGDIRYLEGATDFEVIGSIHDDNERVGAR